MEDNRIRVIKVKVEDLGVIVIKVKSIVYFYASYDGRIMFKLLDGSSLIAKEVYTLEDNLLDYESLVYILDIEDKKW